MTETQRLIHFGEFLLHLALLAARPVWRERFGIAVSETTVAKLRAMVFRNDPPPSSEEIEAAIEQVLGKAGLEWVNWRFISTALPRVAYQDALQSRVIGPSLMPKRAPEMVDALAVALAPTLKRLQAFEDLMITLDADPLHSEDARVIDASRSLLSADAPTRRLLESLYVELMEAALTGGTG